MGLINLGKAFNAVKDIAGKVGDFAGKVANVAGKAVKIMEAPQEVVGGFLKKAAGGLLNKLPFGLGKMAEPFVNKLIDNGLSFLAKGPLAGVTAALTKFAPTVADIANVAEKVKKAADKVKAFEIPEALQNFQEITASAHAEKLENMYLA